MTGKLSYLVVLLVCLSSSAYCFEDFSAWCQMFEKQYSSDGERLHREQVFKSNLELINNLNSQYKTREVVFKINQFGDLTPDEFRSTVLMPSRPPPAHTPLTPHTTPVPDSFDWRDKGVVTPIKDQGSVGSCWAFSTIENIEGQWALAKGNLTSLSAEQLVDCDSEQDPASNNADCGVFGGWPYLAYQYIKKAGGIEAEESYPYCSGFGNCFPCQAPGYNKTRCGPPVPPTSCKASDSCSGRLNTQLFVEGLKVKDWVAIAKDETVMQAELVSRGPLSIAINAEGLQFYHSGVWDTILHCDPKSLDHAVLIVGYGTNDGILDKKPYWLVKNSWGVKWGEKGYFRMVRGKGKCGVDQQVTSAVLQ